MGRYDDMIALPHWEPKNHTRMPAADRAGQFAPFAALTGYDGMVAETARLTDARIEPDEEQRRALNETLQAIMERIAEHPLVRIVHFVEDGRKAGGRYQTTEGHVQDVELHSRLIQLKEEGSIGLDDILSIAVL